MRGTSAAAPVPGTPNQRCAKPCRARRSDSDDSQDAPSLAQVLRSSQERHEVPPRPPPPTRPPPPRRPPRTQPSRPHTDRPPTSPAHVLLALPAPPGQYQTVYNVLSFSLACMMASTIFFWSRVSAIKEKYKTALLITGMVTFIAACECPATCCPPAPPAPRTHPRMRAARRAPSSGAAPAAARASSSGALVVTLTSGHAVPQTTTCIFNSWTESYSYSTAALNPVLTGKPFNDA